MGQWSGFKDFHCILTQERVPNGYERCSVVVMFLLGWGSCCYQIFKFLKLLRFLIDPIKLRLLIGDNIPDFRTLSDF